jgi:hypothetical protein
VHPPLPDDRAYLDDGIHYKLSVDLRAIVTEPMHSDEGRGGHAAHGEWWWRDEVPDDVWPERRPFDAPRLAEYAMNHCCEGDPWPTLRNLLRMQRFLIPLALKRGVVRTRNQPRGLLRCASTRG